MSTTTLPAPRSTRLPLPARFRRAARIALHLTIAATPFVLTPCDSSDHRASSLFK